MCQRITVAHWVTQKLVCTIQEELVLSQGPSLNSKRQQNEGDSPGEKNLTFAADFEGGRNHEPMDCEQFPEAEKGKKINF